MLSKELDPDVFDENGNIDLGAIFDTDNSFEANSHRCQVCRRAWGDYLYYQTRQDNIFEECLVCAECIALLDDTPKDIPLWQRVRLARRSIKKKPLKRLKARSKDYEITEAECQSYAEYVKHKKQAKACVKV